MEYQYRPPENGMNDLVLETSRTVSRVGLAFVVLIAGSSLASFILQVIALVWFRDIIETGYFNFGVTILSLYVCAAPFAYLILRPMKKEVPKHRRISVKTFVIFTVMAFTLLILGSFLGQWLNAIVERICGIEQGGQVSEAFSESSLWLSCLYALVIAPIMEELFFRKLLIDRLSYLGDITCVVVSGLAFGLFHQNIEQFFYATLLGALLAFVYLKTGKILYTMLIHSIINFFGGILPTIVEHFLPVDFFAAETEEALSELISANPGAYIALMATSYLPYLFAIIGLVFFILYARRLTCGLRPSPLPYGRKASPIIGNAGVIVYLICCVGMMVFTIFA